MHKLVKWDKGEARAAIATASAFIVSAVLLVFFMPRESKFGLEYELGKPWRYAPLIASYDFPVYKTKEQLAAERDSVLRDFRPLYQRDTQAGAQYIKALRQDFYTGKMKGVPAYYLPYLVERLRTVYAAGILSSDDLASLSRQGASGISVLAGREAVQQPVNALFSTRSAYEYAMHSDTLRYTREMLARCNLNNYIYPTLRLDTARTKALRDDLLGTISLSSGMVQSGQKIIDRGEIVSAQQYDILLSFERESKRRNDPSQDVWLLVAGQGLFVCAMLSILLVYVGLFCRDYLRSPHSMLMLFSLVTLFPLITSWLSAAGFQAAYVVPFAMVPIFVRIFLDWRTALMALTVSTLLASLSLHAPYEFFLLQITSGIASVFALKDLTERSQLLRAVALVTLSTLLVAVAFDLSQGISPADFDRSRYACIIAGGVLLLFSYPLMYVVEMIFGFTSNVALVELTNINNSILRKMSKVAQGTFNHSMTVANLAAEVANKIGAKAQLVRTAALYHDVGKMLNPAFFTENQSGVNPHDSLSEERSAQIIISHVTEGVRLAEKYHLPKVIRDFIVTHHGRSKVKYFYIQWCNKHPGEKPNEALFTYPGPNPFTREQAILMMCDAVEATSRSLKEFTEESIRELVNRIVDGQVAEGYFRDCPVTFRDITEAKQALIESLKTIYHTRVAYPELNRAPAPNPAPRSGLFGGRGRRPWER